MELKRDNIHTKGTGSGACIHMYAYWGIGDIVAALPALAVYAREQPTECYVHGYHTPLLEKIPGITPVGCYGSWHKDGFAIGSIQCDNGDILDPMWNPLAAKKYADIWKLGDPLFMMPPENRAQQMADELGVKYDVEFDYDILRQPNDAESRILFSPDSTKERTLPNAEKRFEELPDALWLSLDKGGPRVTIDTLQELIATIQAATHVYAVDNGVAHLACALGVPTTVYYGPTGVETIFNHYKQFRDFKLTFQE